MCFQDVLLVALDESLNRGLYQLYFRLIAILVYSYQVLSRTQPIIQQRNRITPSRILRRIGESCLKSNDNRKIYKWIHTQISTLNHHHYHHCYIYTKYFFYKKFLAIRKLIIIIISDSENMPDCAKSIQMNNFFGVYLYDFGFGSIHPQQQRNRIKRLFNIVSWFLFISYIRRNQIVIIY